MMLPLVREISYGKAKRRRGFILDYWPHRQDTPPLFTPTKRLIDLVASRGRRRAEWDSVEHTVDRTPASGAERSQTQPEV